MARLVEFRAVSLLLAVGLVVASCSGSGSADSGESGAPGSVTRGSETSVVSETTNPVAKWTDGLPSPSTTISSDPDMQAAANVVFWRYEFFMACIADLPNCDPSEDKGAGGAVIPVWVASIEDKQAENLTTLSDPRAHEQTIFSVRESLENPGDVVVLQCRRNYHIFVGPDGEVVDNTSPVVLRKDTVRRGVDSEWQVFGTEIVAQTQPEEEGGDQCQQYKDFAG